jgi:hypothetical protein
MPLQGHGRSSLEVTNGRPLCTQCRVPMWAVFTDKRETEDQRAFECPCCGQAHNSRRMAMTLSARVR